jgi:lipoprotein-anchoring transpeptidase ErfK/SrfK
VGMGSTGFRAAALAAGSALAVLVLLAPPASAQLHWDWGGDSTVAGDSGRRIIRFSSQFEPGQVIVSFADRRLYFIAKPGEAISYPIAVPRAEDRWEGVTTVSEKKVNPPWTPTQAMLAENPRLPRWVPGGHPMNPLGVRALYLGSSLYRIHGTDAPWTIGTSASKGCIRLYNRDMLDLYPRVALDAIVVVTWRRFTTAPRAGGAGRSAAVSNLGYGNASARSLGRGTTAQSWYCQPTAPNGRVVCHPIVGYGKR